MTLEYSFLTSSLSTQIQTWVCSIYAKMNVWQEYTRHDEYNEIITFLEFNYEEEELKNKAIEINKKNNYGNSTINKAEVQCLQFIIQNGKIPRVIKRDMYLENLKTSDMPISLQNIIHFLKSKDDPNNIYRECILLENDYYELCQNTIWSNLLDTLLEKYPILKDYMLHISNINIRCLQYDLLSTCDASKVNNSI